MRMRALPALLSIFLSLWTLGGSCSKSGTSPEEEIGNVEFDMLAYVLRSELGGVSRMIALPGISPGCMTISSMDDSDQDGVPEDADLVFSEAGCHFDIDNGYGTTSGSLHVTDPGSSFGFSASLDGLASVYSTNNGARIERLAVSGQRQVAGSPTEVTLTQNVQFTLSITGRPTATGSETWQAVFTPVQGSQVSLNLGARLPDGGMVVSGPLVFTQSGTTAQLSLSTTTPIRWDPTCGSPFPTGGEVHAQVVSGGPSGYVKIVWSSCGGEAEVDFVEG